MPIVIEEYRFEGPYAFLHELSDRQGVYAVLCRMDSGRHFLVDVGEADNVREAVSAHDRKRCWAENCKGVIRLAVLYTPDLDGPGRADIVSFIRSREFVPCGGDGR